VNTDVSKDETPSIFVLWCWRYRYGHERCWLVVKCLAIHDWLNQTYYWTHPPLPGGRTRFYARSVRLAPYSWTAHGSIQIHQQKII